MKTPPFLWIEELRILRTWSALPKEEVRRITFRKGLNIVWADASSQTELDLPGFGGHAAGKTSLCRLLRFVLGEIHYGSRFMRDRILNAFQDGWVAAKVWIGDAPWIVGRAFRSSYHPVAMQTDVFKRIFATAETQGRFDDFRSALEEVIMAPFPVHEFAAEKEPITFAHLLEWLSRDQECRLAGLLDWRHESSHHGSPKMTAEQRRFLIRNTLHLVDDLVRNEIERRQPLQDEVDAIPADIAFERRNLQEGLDALRIALSPEPVPHVGESLFVDAVRRIAQKRRDDQLEEIDKAIVAIDIRALREAADRTNRDLGAKEFQEQELKEYLERQTTNLQEAERGGTEASYDQFWEKLKPSDQYCRVPIPIARFRCPLRQEFEPNSTPSPLKADFAAIAEEAKKIIAEIARDLKPVSLAREALEREVADHQLRIAVAETKIEAMRRKKAAIVEAHTVTLFRADQAGNACKRIESLETRETELQKSIETSKLNQEALQARQNKEIGEFSDLYKLTLQALLGTGIEAECRFTREEISLHADHLGELTSGAIDTLKILAFDIAVMHAALRGIGHHPRFIIFDSPREADMHPIPYQRFIRHVQNLEESSLNAPFQIIITTTEPPPKYLQDSPSVILLLDASIKEKRLYCTNL